jgi:FKBP-type peptidyl-prolyl cis-trans isomerase
MKFSLSVTLVAVAATLAVGCGSGSTTTSAEEAATATARFQDRPPGMAATANPNQWGTLKRFAGQWSNRLLVPDGPSPDRVLHRDLRPGSGRAIEPDDSFTANYVSFYYEDGEIREDHWQTDPEQFFWNMDRLVDAWLPGLEGVRAGGIRELVAPSSWTYENGPLVYLVKVERIEPS